MSMLSRQDAVEPALTPDSIPLSRYAGLLRRYAGLLTLMLLGGLALGGLKLVVAPRSYTSTVDVLAPPVAMHAGIARSSLEKQEEVRPPKETTMDTEAQIVYSGEVLARLRGIPGFDLSRRELKKRITITVPPNTRVLSIAVKSGDAGDSKRAADMVASAYLTVRQRIMGAIQERNRAILERRVNLLRAQLKALPGDEKELKRVTARTRRQEIVKEVDQTREDLAAAEVKAVQPGEVVRDARRPERADGLRGEVALATGAGLGLTGWLLITNFRDRRPRRIRRPADLRLSGRMPVLVESPIVGGGHRHLCRRLRNLVFEEEARAVLVVGMPPGAAAGIARELAVLCAEAGSVTTLLDAQGERSAASDPGDGDLPLHLRAISTDDGDRELNHSISLARENSDIVVIITSGLESADTLSAAAACDLVFVAAQRGRALDRELAGGLALLEHAALPASGVVLTGPPTPATLPAPVKSSL